VALQLEGGTTPVLLQNSYIYTTVPSGFKT